MKGHGMGEREGGERGGPEPLWAIPCFHWDVSGKAVLGRPVILATLQHLRAGAKLGVACLILL